MKILHLITTLDLGGAERHLYFLVRETIRKGYQIEVAYLKGQGKMEPFFRKLGVKVFPLHMKTIFDPRCIFSLYRLIRKNRYSIIHTHLFKADFLGGIVGKFAGCPRIISTKHNIDLYLKNQIFGLLGRWIASIINYRVIAISYAVKDFLLKLGFPKKKIVVIHYGLGEISLTGKSVRKELLIPEDKIVITCVARLYPQKGHIYLIQALEKIKKTYSNFVCLLVGDGPLRNELEREVKRRNLEKEVIFMGWRNDVGDILAGSDFLVLPSLWEGFGLVILEAMSLHKPVVATRVGPIPEIIIEEKTGILVSPQNVEELSNAILRMISEPELRRKMGEAGWRRLRENFSLEKMIEKYVKFYS
ncbi:MAG TPA: glycosyltransferase, partial [bacterium]|nr:glycosyltransferase [bacterium]HEX67912.1 glycosyltransferase [bacterium]